MKVLIIDDDEDIRKIARISLANVGGMEVADAASAPEGVRAAAASVPDVILLDVMMPDMDGPATFAALRAEPATREVPVVFLTAKVLAFEIERLHGLGAHGVLVKPFDPMTFPDELRALLARKD